MPDDISQKDQARFSHVTIGQTDADASACGEDEEVMLIGAVDALGARGAACAPETGADDAATAVQVGMTTQDGDDAGPQAAEAAEAALDIEEAALGMPMSLAQRMLVVAALVGVLVVVAYLIWFWAFR
jgi:hypothetical protein